MRQHQAAKAQGKRRNEGCSVIWHVDYANIIGQEMKESEMISVRTDIGGVIQSAGETCSGGLFVDGARGSPQRHGMDRSYSSSAPVATIPRFTKARLWPW